MPYTAYLSEFRCSHAVHVGSSRPSYCPVTVKRGSMASNFWSHALVHHLTTSNGPVCVSLSFMTTSLTHRPVLTLPLCTEGRHHPPLHTRQNFVGMTPSLRHCRQLRQSAKLRHISSVTMPPSSHMRCRPAGAPCQHASKPAELMAQPGTRPMPAGAQLLASARPRRRRPHAFLGTARGRSPSRRSPRLATKEPVSKQACAA